MTERPFAFSGINHLALVCRDMERTVDFYTNVLGLELVKTIDLPQGMGQHFFFDIGGGDCLAFFCFPAAPAAAPGIASAPTLPTEGEITTAIGSMNHVALSVPPERIEQYRDRLVERGVRCTEILNHDDSEWGITRDVHDGTFIRSVYFFDPDGILLELAAWTRALGPEDVRHAPRSAAAPVASA